MASDAFHSGQAGDPGKPWPLVACALPAGIGDMKSRETRKVLRPECLAVPLEGWEQSH